MHQRTKVSERKIRKMGKKIHRSEIINEIAKEHNVQPAMIEDIIDEFFSSEIMKLTKTGDALEIPGYLSIYRYKKHIKKPISNTEKSRIYMSNPKNRERRRARRKRAYKLRIQNMWRTVNGFPTKKTFIRKNSLLYQTMPGETRIKKIYREFMNNYNK